MLLPRRVPPGDRLIHGATLTVSTMGGYSVIHDGDYLGYLHASLGDQWNVYRRDDKAMDEHLGRCTLESGVLAILRATGRASEAAA